MIYKFYLNLLMYILNGRFLTAQTLTTDPSLVHHRHKKHHPHEYFIIVYENISIKKLFSASHDQTIFQLSDDIQQDLHLGLVHPLTVVRAVVTNHSPRHVKRVKERHVVARHKTLQFSVKLRHGRFLRRLVCRITKYTKMMIAGIY